MENLTFSEFKSKFIACQNCEWWQIPDEFKRRTK